MHGLGEIDLYTSIPITYLLDNDYRINIEQEGLDEGRNRSEGHNKKASEPSKQMREIVRPTGLGRKEGYDHIGGMRTKRPTKQGYLERYQSIARGKGGECLSTEYTRNSAKLWFKCKRNHIWGARPNNIQQGKWCPHCAHVAKLTLEDIQVIAEKRGGRCLSMAYLNSYTSIEFQCHKGHSWFARPNSIRQGAWCPKCWNAVGGRDCRKQTIQDMQAIAKSRNGKCVSKEYDYAIGKLEWECEQGHRWWAAPNSIKNNESWCPECAGVKKKTIEDMHELARAHGGKCHSTHYTNNNTKIEWECTNGHRFHTTPNSVQSGRWCPKCGGSEKLTIGFMHELAQEHDGKCLSTRYINAHSNIRWECEQGHEWEARGNSVSMGHWCPDCHVLVSTGENHCKMVLETIFELPFKREYHEWLINPQTDNLLSLDGFNYDAGVAFEYNGKQHYDRVPHWQTQAEFEDLVERDKLKSRICKELNITLITIPYWIELNDISDFIKQELESEGVVV